VLISCIMPTRNRPTWAARALEAFYTQAWGEKEIIIIDDRDQPSFPEPPVGFGVIYHRMQRRMVIGAKRNLACSRAVGDLICHWDDDDFSAAGRIEDQVRTLMESGAQVTGYHSMLFEGRGETWMYRKQPPYAIGTSLMYRREFWRRNPFRDVQVAEDEAFVRQAIREGVLVSTDAGDMMRATNHAGNTSPRVFVGKNWSKVA
jgi:glycosyltransferase involved in cell wall biosynthesis